jgi:staphylococcal nuclease domain-containing protein 1
MAARPIEGRVKAVLSGDTIVLQSPTNPKAERVISLAYVTAPRLRKDGADEVSLFFQST